MIHDGGKHDVAISHTPFLGTCLSQGLMFSKDFKQQCQGVDLLREALPELLDEVLSQLDLLFRCAHVLLRLTSHSWLVVQVCVCVCVCSGAV